MLRCLLVTVGLANLLCKKCRLTPANSSEKLPHGRHDGQNIFLHETPTLINYCCLQQILSCYSHLLRIVQPETSETLQTDSNTPSRLGPAEREQQISRKRNIRISVRKALKSSNRSDTFQAHPVKWQLAYAKSRVRQSRGAEDERQL